MAVGARARCAGTRGVIRNVGNTRGDELEGVVEVGDTLARQEERVERVRDRLYGWSVARKATADRQRRQTAAKVGRYGKVGWTGRSMKSSQENKMATTFNRLSQRRARTSRKWATRQRQNTRQAERREKAGRRRVLSRVGAKPACRHMFNMVNALYVIRRRYRQRRARASR